jgi:hypothetical protein
MANKNFIIKNGITLEGYGEIIDSGGNWTGVAIGGSVDSAQVLSIVTADGFTKLDSANVSSIITADVDAAFINALTIDADTLGSQAGSYYLDYTNFTNTPTILDSANITDLIDSAYVNARASGGAINDIFYENSTNVTANYTITSGKNAMSAGPIIIDSGYTVTIPSGSEWTVV